MAPCAAKRKRVHTKLLGCDINLILNTNSPWLEQQTTQCLVGIHYTTVRMEKLCTGLFGFMIMFLRACTAMQTYVQLGPEITWSY